MPAMDFTKAQAAAIPYIDHGKCAAGEQKGPGDSVSRAMLYKPHVKLRTVVAHDGKEYGISGWRLDAKDLYESRCLC